MKKILVIPSIREECFNRFMDAWKDKGDWDEVILVEDNPERTFKNTFNKAFHYSWKEISEVTSNNSWIFSKRDSAIRSFGFYIAWLRGADYILTLDDDCYPYHDDPILEEHINVMNSFEKWTCSLPRKRTRGLPYHNNGRLDTVVANMGLWTGYPDFDAVQSLSCPVAASNGQFYPDLALVGNRVIPSNQYFPLCGMNFCFKREVAPLAYFPLMGQDQPYSRFDDIWFGIIFKKIIDHLGWNVSVGEPFVIHQKASNVFTNLKKEAPGIEANEWFWNKIDDIWLGDNNHPISCMEFIGGRLQYDENKYIQNLGRAIHVWANLFKD
jgi:reversibly glycosylated polypeptide / UDP-arabinopyranose mutase